MIRYFSWICIALAILLTAALISGSWAQCTTCNKGEEEWGLTAQNFLKGCSTEQNSSSLSPAQRNSLDTLPQESSLKLPQRSSSFYEMLAPLSSVYSYDVILDVSPEPTEYIQGAVSIPYTKFLDDGALKPVSEVAKILGDAGISRDDSVLIYGKCLPCEGNPLTSTYGYWMLRYLGHEKVKMLDGGIDEWVASKGPTETAPSSRTKKNYTPQINSKLLATYDFVKNGDAQIVDARAFQEYGLGSIPRSLNIPYDRILSNGVMREEVELRDIFVRLSKNRPVVVYTDTSAKASIVWFALELMGYDARLYSWKDWLENVPGLNIELEELRAEPNPARIGSAIRITAVFRESQNNSSSNPMSEENRSNATEETVLTIKVGCATCGFGSPQGFASINSSGGVVRLGYSGRSLSNPQADAFKATALIQNAEGLEVDRTTMKRISGDRYSGIWNANVAPGEYKAIVVASALGSTKIFEKDLEIKVLSAK